MMIPFFDYLTEYRRLEAELAAATARVLESGALILGPEVTAFEREFAAYCGAAHGVGVASGTDALTLALLALEIGAGDEVITVANAGVPTITAILAAGAHPRFVDVDPATLLIDPAGLEAARTPRTRAIIPVHLYGQVVPPAPLQAFAERHGLALVEDCAQAHGARFEGRHAGRFGRIGCFSFYPTKNLGAFGDGGLCLTDDDALARRLRSLRCYGWDERRSSTQEGRNSRLDELQAALLRVKLRDFDRAVAARRRIVENYRRALSGAPYGMVQVPPGSNPAWHLFVLQSPERARILDGLREAGIGYGLHYEHPVQRMPPFAGYGRPPGGLPVTDRACATVFSLPLYPHLTDADLGRVVETLRRLA